MFALNRLVQYYLLFNGGGRKAKLYFWNLRFTMNLIDFFFFERVR